MWGKHCERDLTMIVIHYVCKEGIERNVRVCSAYFPSDDEDAPPPLQSRDLVRKCEAYGLDLVIGCDANAHLTV